MTFVHRRFGVIVLCFAVAAAVLPVVVLAWDHGLLNGWAAVAVILTSVGALVVVALGLLLGRPSPVAAASLGAGLFTLFMIPPATELVALVMLTQPDPQSDWDPRGGVISVVAIATLALGPCFGAVVGFTSWGFHAILDRAHGTFA
ncbi:MAG: hypothetical protein Q7T33_07420 [Dehalococcoidia bacterium]|nr:hypothetical protein [Dehalococcoidia bacterium]